VSESFNIQPVPYSAQRCLITPGCLLGTGYAKLLIKTMNRYPDHTSDNSEPPLKADSPPDYSKAIPSPIRIIIIVAIVAFLCEAVVMLVLPVFPPMPTWAVALVDASLLVVLLSPLIYFGLYRSMVKIIRLYKQAEDQLKTYRNHLEEMVEEKTAALMHALDESHRRESEVSALLEGSRAVLKYREFSAASRSIFNQCKNLIGAKAGYVALLDEAADENILQFLDSGGLPCKTDPLLPMPIRGLREEAYHTGRAVYDNAFADSRWVELLPDGHVHLENVLFAPLVLEGETVGIIGLANKPDGFNANDARIATAFGEIASVALFNSQTLDLLENSEKRFRSVVETAVDAIISVNREGNIVFWNLGAESLFGYSADEIAGKPVAIIIPARFKDAHESALQRVISSGKTTVAGQSRQMTGLRKNGSEFPLELSLAKWKTNEGLFFTAIIRDITHRVRAEEELQKRTYELGERVKELNCLYGLSNLFERPGISLEEILQETVELIPPSWQYPDITCARITLESLEYKTQNFKESAWRQASDILVHGTRTGVLEVFYLEEKPEIDEGPFLKEERSLINAISERLGRIMELRRASEALNRAHRELEKRVKERTAELMIANEKLKAEIQEHEFTQEQLLHSKAELQTIFDGISDPLLLFDKNLVIKSLNRRAAAYYGIDNPQQCIGKYCHEVFKGESSPCEGCEVPFAVSNRQSLTFERRYPKNPDRLEQVFVYPVKETDTETGDAIIRISDITEAKKFERQLIHSEKMASLGVLVSSIVHEINNPNNFVTFNIPILRDYLNELMPIIDDYAEERPDYELCHMSYPEFRQDIFKLIDNLDHGAGRIKHFVQNLRDFSRSTTSAPRQWVDPKPLIDKVFTICKAKIGRTVKSLIKNIPQDLPQIHTDPYALEQILINMLINSSQAADKNNSFIRVGVAVGHTWQDHILIEVRDNGCGMDQATWEKIFQPFFTTKISGEGTGLGLYVCVNLVEGLGGRIEVESEPGEGSTFTIILPGKERRLRKRV